MTPLETYKLDSQIGYLLRLASQRHGAIFQAHAPKGLTPTQFSALLRVAELGSLSQNHLGRLAAMDVATIKGVVDRLKHKGLLRVEPDPNDKRRLMLSLSPDGSALIAGLCRAGQDITSETLAPLCPEEQQTLIRLLTKIT